VRRLGPGPHQEPDTSVNQIERFYAKRLPISKELMENLLSFGN
jgi:hypothetical protein